MAKMMQCKSCSKEIAVKAKSCLGCGAKNKKPVYKKVWFWMIVLIIVFSAMGSTGADDSSEPNNKIVQSSQEITDDTNIAVEASKENSTENNVSTEFKSALRKAKSYSETMYMSKVGIFDQLNSEYGEKFPVEAAQYAVDNLQ